MNAVLRPAVPTLLPLRGLQQWWHRAALVRRQKAEARALMALGQHELNDLGVGRSELPALVREAD
ncbi:MAG TPA: hypothetical protein VE084_07490 [Burkholderiaceae bacterium]|nr:hypothetical protein [Burkholderiaceae bacterium]